MKRFMMLFLLLALLTPAALAGEQTAPQNDMLLMTTYTNFAWRWRFEFAALDEGGVLWHCDAMPKGEIRQNPADMAQYLKDHGLLTEKGRISPERLRDLKSMADTVPEQPVQYAKAARDAGIQKSYALRRDGEGRITCILLGASGDGMYENNDPSAQALYRFLREAFPDVRAFAGVPDMSPAGFPKQDLRTFSGCEGIDLAGLSMTALKRDCKSGIAEIAPRLSAEALMKMQVTGKRNSFQPSGNVISYVFKDKDGHTAAFFDFFDGLLVKPDGMYEVE